MPHRDSGAALRLMTAEKPFDAALWIAKEISRMVGREHGGRFRRRKASGQVRSLDIAVLCRTRHQLGLMESCLRHEHPCVIYGGTTFWPIPRWWALWAFSAFCGTPGI